VNECKHFGGVKKNHHFNSFDGTHQVDAHFRANVFLIFQNNYNNDNYSLVTHHFANWSPFMDGSEPWN
jgi:hypothetical protein